MYDFVVNMLKYIQSPELKFRDFLGQYQRGGDVQYGPFMSIVPEAVGTNGPSLPYMVFDILSQPMDQGFGGLGASYGEKPIIVFHLYDSDSSRVLQNTELFTSVIDIARPSDFMGQCASIVRRENMRVIVEPINKDGSRIYHTLVSYEFRINRNKGEPSTST